MPLRVLVPLWLNFFFLVFVASPLRCLRSLSPETLPARSQYPALTADRLHVAVRTRAIDEDRCVFFREVKAITYHALDIVSVPGGFQATVIVDI